MSNIFNKIENFSIEEYILLVCILIMIGLIEFFIASGKWKDNILLTVSYVILLMCFILVSLDCQNFAIILSTVSSVCLGLYSDRIRKIKGNR